MRQNWLEWVALAVSAVVLVALIGFLVYDGATDTGRPPSPAVELHLDEAYTIDGGWIVPATVRNDGEVAAEAIVLRATTTVGDGEEESELALDYLPAGTEVEISFGFSAAPESEVSVQVVGFRLP
jgi:uncharacterized protein (TIGR02588 family)